VRRGRQGLPAYHKLRRMCFKKLLLKVQESEEPDYDDENKDKLVLLLEEFCDKLNHLLKVCMYDFTPNWKEIGTARDNGERGREKDIGKQLGGRVFVYTSKSDDTSSMGDAHYLVYTLSH